MKSVLDMPTVDRPREKLLNRGPTALDDRELLAVILGRGARGAPVLKVADQVLKTMSRPGFQWQQLQMVSGVGSAKTALLRAAMEFARRRMAPDGLKIREPHDVLPLLRVYAHQKQEHFICVSLNGANEIIAIRVVTVGLVNRSHVHPREVFADPITDRASAIIVAHNHPSGNLVPGKADHDTTKRLKDAGKLLGIFLLDHLIFSARGHYSFAQERTL